MEIIGIAIVRVWLFLRVNYLSLVEESTFVKENRFQKKYHLTQTDDDSFIIECVHCLNFRPSLGFLLRGGRF